MDRDVLFMKRCLSLARLGKGTAAPNPMVGAVLVHDDRIIGEGYHQNFGQAHAEVNCIASVKMSDRPLIGRSTMYVSLEPCAHHGKTPPCTDLIIENKIPRVMIAMQDPFSKVNGKGIMQLQHAGIEVKTGMAEDEARWLNRRFITFHASHRPYVILKWAQTLNGKMAGNKGERIPISNIYSNRLVHRWRSEESAILIGKKTALIDDPLLTNRYWNGRSPQRIVLDNTLSLPGHLHIFNGSPTIVLNQIKDGKEGNKHLIKYDASDRPIGSILEKLHGIGIQSMLVEGGPALLRSFMEANCWDEIRTITNESKSIESTVHAPELPDILPSRSMRLGTDTIRWYYK